MTLKLYSRNISPSCRAVLLTAKAVGITLQYIQVNIGENLDPEFVKLNPQHTVPTLVDDDKVIWDSHAINVYLVSKYAKDDSLYPEDLYKRAIVNQRLHFDSAVAFPLAKQIRNLIVLSGIKTIPSEQVEAANEVYEFLERFVGNHRWMTGDDMTLADLSLIPTVTCLDFMLPIASSKFPNLTDWIKRAQSLPYYALNEEGHEVMKTHFLKLLSP